MTGRRLAAQTSFYAQRVDFYLGDQDQAGNRLLATKIDFEPVTEGLCTEPSFSLPMDMAQELFEQMWRQGFRSLHDKGSAENLDAARREHIADLQKAAKLR
jgi:hypothetical protein